MCAVVMTIDFFDCGIIRQRSGENKNVHLYYIINTTIFVVDNITGITLRLFFFFTNIVFGKCNLPSLQSIYATSTIVLHMYIVKRYSIILKFFFTYYNVINAHVHCVVCVLISYFPWRTATAVVTATGITNIICDKIQNN